MFAGGGRETRERRKKMTVPDGEIEQRGEYQNPDPYQTGADYDTPAEPQNPFASPKDWEIFDEGFDDDAQEIEVQGDQETIDEPFYADDEDKNPTAADRLASEYQRILSAYGPEGTRDWRDNASSRYGGE